MPKGRAILIGVNEVDPKHYDGWSGPLNACEFDAESLAEIARSEKLGVTSLLTKKATRANVLNALRKAAKDLRDGDLLLLSYSGHGGQVPDRNHDEEDMVDETWCLFDAELLDDELNAEFARFRKGVRIFMLSDSCHSGTVAKMSLVGEITGSTPSRREVVYRNMPMDVAFRTYQRNKKFYDAIQVPKGRSAKQKIACSVLLISGCQDNQLSADGTFNGLFTSNLLQVWGGGRFDGSYESLHRRIRKRMPPDQTPNLFWGSEVNSAFLKARPFTV